MVDLRINQALLGDVLICLADLTLEVCIFFDIILISMISGIMGVQSAE